MTPTLKAARLHVDNTRPLKWGWSSLCSSDAQLMATATYVLTNSAIQQPGESHQPLQLLSAEVIDDPLDQFSLYLSVSMTQEYGLLQLSLPQSVLKPEYMQLEAPYPCKVLLRTTGGTRLLTVGAVNGLSEAEQYGFALQKSLAKARRGGR